MGRAKRKIRLDRGIKVRSDSVYVLSSLKEILYLTGPRLLLVGGLLMLPVVLSPWPYWSRVALSACILCFLALSFDFLANNAGLLCLGGAFFYGVGGYTAAVLNTQLSLPYYLSIPLGAVIGAVICTVSIYPCLPLTGIYFAVVTLMYPLLARRLIEATNVLGGTEGLRGISGFSTEGIEQYALIILLLIAIFGLRRFSSATPGLLIRAVKDNDQAVRASGISVTWCRTKALFIGSLLGCFAGAYYVHMYRSVGVSSFALDLSILPIAATVIGGGGSSIGAVIGSFILVPLGEFLREFGSLRIALYALILTGFIVFRSEGLFPFVARKYAQFEKSVEI